MDNEQMTEEMRRALEALMGTTESMEPPLPAYVMGGAMIRLGAFMMASCNTTKDAFIKHCQSQFADAAAHQKHRANGEHLH